MSSATNYRSMDSPAAAGADRYKAIADTGEPDDVDLLSGGEKVLMTTENDGLMRDTAATTADGGVGERQASQDSAESNESNGTDNSDDDDEFDISLEELIYSSSSYYAIAKPVTLTMVLAALAVVYINNDITRQQGEDAMASAYQVFNVNDGTQSNSQNLALSLANALIMVSVICAMTFMVVILYRLKFIKCLVGYMILCSGTLLGMLGGNILQTAVNIYKVPVDKPTFFLFIFNFCLVGVLSVFFGQGIPKYVTQGYLIATSVILAWHLSFFDDWTTWTLLFMLAVYDLCAVLTPCGPLKALVDAMSHEDAPEMPGLLFEAELPAEVKRPAGMSRKRSAERSSREHQQQRQQQQAAESADGASQMSEDPTISIPLAIARVYQLPVISVPAESMQIMFPTGHGGTTASSSAAPLLIEDDANVILPENPTPAQLQANVVVRLPASGGRLENVQRRGKKVYLERDRHGNPKRFLWVDRNGKVFAEMREDDEEGPDQSSIRLGLGDFIFYSVLVSKAAEYSFCTFAACVLVILAGLGGTLVLLSVYHHALPALPISIFLGVVFYFTTRLWMEPFIEAVLSAPYYV